MNTKNAMISQQARTIAASASIANGKKDGRIRESQSDRIPRHYSFAFFIGVMISIIGALCLGFLLGVIGII